MSQHAEIAGARRETQEIVRERLAAHAPIKIGSHARWRAFERQVTLDQIVAVLRGGW